LIAEFVLSWQRGERGRLCLEGERDRKKKKKKKKKKKEEEEEKIGENPKLRW